MKDLVNYICESEKALCSIVQYETDKHASYTTLNFSNAEENHKYGFLVAHLDDKFVTVDSFDDPRDFDDLVNIDTYKDLTGMKPGESKKVGDEIFTRLW